MGSDTAEEKGLRIAPSRYGGHWYASDWAALDFTQESEWQRAINIFEDRIRGRFLDIVDEIQEYVFAGFAVMALDCLLMETLQQFFEGVHETPRRQSGEYFRRFLTQTSFAPFFGDDKPKLFFDHIRCGILHQAEVKGDSRIIITGGTPMVRQVDNGLIINRRLFHQQLVCEFNHYVARLRQNDPPDDELRRKFRCKMDAICQLNPSPARVGILAYGSLLTDPGKELGPRIVQRISAQTPFEVEYARSSTSRCGAPTLVCVPDGRGRKVNVKVLVLDESVTETEASDMLYRREIHCVGEKSKVYDDQRQRAKRNAVVIERLPDFAGVLTVLYTSLPANIALLENDAATDEEKATELARLALASVTEKTFCSQRDGILYLENAIRNGIQTQLTDLYRAAILRLAGDTPDLKTARLWAARHQGLLEEKA